LGGLGGGGERGVEPLPALPEALRGRRAGPSGEDVGGAGPTAADRGRKRLPAAGGRRSPLARAADARRTRYRSRLAAATGYALVHGAGIAVVAQRARAGRVGRVVRIGRHPRVADPTRLATRV